jgi:hypothetical protein
MIEDALWRAEFATGLGQSGGVFSWPDVPELGYETWSSMTSVEPGHPLVGGSGPGSLGYGPAHGMRQVALAQPAPAQGAAAGSPASANWRELFNLKGNPLPWVLLAAILYLGLMHIHVRAGATGGFTGGVGK